MNNPKFQIFKSTANNQYYYHLRAVNGEMILSGEGYTSKENCKNGIASVKVNATNDSRYERKNGYYYSFNLNAANGQIIGTSETYSTQLNREGGIAAVKRDAPGAPIEDLS